MRPGHRGIVALGETLTEPEKLPMLERTNRPSSRPEGERVPVIGAASGQIPHPRAWKSVSGHCYVDTRRRASREKVLKTCDHG
jgi:hypothetical protein